MSFLHHLWDETVAGPVPAEAETGKLRRYNSTPAPGRVSGDALVSRSITVPRANPGLQNLSVDPGCGPDSPSWSTTPRTPLTPGAPVTTGGDFRKFTRRKPATGQSEPAEPRSPTVYDWIVISALDR